MKTPRIACITSLILFAAVLGAYLVLRGVVNAESVAVAELDQQIVSKTAETARLTSVRDRLAALGGVAGELEAYFVSESDVVSFINGLQARGDALGATVEIGSVAAVPASAKMRSMLKVSLTIQGTFDAVMRTVGSLGHAPYALSVTDLALSYDQAQKTWGASMNVVIDTSNAPTALATPSAPVATPAASTTPVLATSTPPAATTTITPHP